jgi:hypothetical protein
MNFQTGKMKRVERAQVEQEKERVKGGGGIGLRFEAAVDPRAEDPDHAKGHAGHDRFARVEAVGSAHEGFRIGHGWKTNRRKRTGIVWIRSSPFDKGLVTAADRGREIMSRVS